MTVRTDQLGATAFDNVVEASGAEITPIHPSEILHHEFMEPLVLTPSALGRAVGVPTNRITVIVHGERWCQCRYGMALGTTVRDDIGVLAEPAKRLRAALRNRPIYMTHRNRPTYVILSEAEYQRVVGCEKATERLWDALLAEGKPGERTASEIGEQIRAERDSWM